MLGLSFVVGWYISLRLAAWPPECRTCYVVTPLRPHRLAPAVRREQPGRFHGIGDVFAIRSGGMVAYAASALVGSIGYRGHPLMPRTSPCPRWRQGSSSRASAAT
jgi:hypothetical protein